VGFPPNLDTETVDQCGPEEPLCLAPDDTVGTALRLMREQNRGAALICRDSVLVGIFTERDALRRMAEAKGFDAPLAQFMTSKPVALCTGDTVGRAIMLMAKGGYRRLPIVDDHGHPTGIVRVEGIMHFLVEHFPTMIYNLPPEPHHSMQSREGA
jgi:CBS domain-containing protein